MRLKIGAEYSDKNSTFEQKFFFKVPSKILVGFTNLFKVSEKSTRMAHQSSYMSKSEKNWNNFQKVKLKMRLEYLTKPHVFQKT